MSPVTPGLRRAALLGAACALLLTTVVRAQQAPAPPAGGAGARGAGAPAAGRAGGGPPQGELAAVAGPALDAAAVERGGNTYRQSCGFCHGAEARGAVGPDLTRSLAVLNDTGGKELGEFLKAGVPDKGMPAFPTLTAAEATDLEMFLRARIADARRRAPFNPASVVVGDAAAGAAYFNGAGGCAACHSPTGNLKGIGSKYDPAALQAKMVNPRAGRGATTLPSTVKVTEPGGRVTTGQLVSINDFFVTLLDPSGNRRTFSRDDDAPKVEVNDPLRAHLTMIPKYTDKAMHDLVAYLVTVR
ncbi:MAG: cytochrome c [Acidobacteriota bacterium]